MRSTIQRTAQLLAAAAVLSAAMFWAGAAGAQGNRPSGSKVVVLDVVRVFNEYMLQKDLSTELQQAQTQLQGTAKDKQARTEAMAAQVDKIDPSDPTYPDRARELLRMQADNKVWFEMTQAAITNELAIWSNRIYQDIVNEAGALSREQGYDVVLYRDEFEAGFDPEQTKERIRRRKTIWYSPSVDITDAVLQRLNARYANQPKTPKLQIPK
jgi:Skp family chaperone for outer membrane proteins